MWDVNLVSLNVFSIGYIYITNILYIIIYNIYYIYIQMIEKRIEKLLNSIKPCIKTPACSQERNDQLQNQRARLI